MLKQFSFLSPNAIFIGIECFIVAIFGLTLIVKKSCRQYIKACGVIPILFSFQTLLEKCENRRMMGIDGIHHVYLNQDEPQIVIPSMFMLLQRCSSYIVRYNIQRSSNAIYLQKYYENTYIALIIFMDFSIDLNNVCNCQLFNHEIKYDRH